MVARNNDEAERIKRGVDVTRLREEPGEAEAAALEAEKFFEPEAAEFIRESEETSETPPATETN